MKPAGQRRSGGAMVRASLSHPITKAPAFAGWLTSLLFGPEDSRAAARFRAHSVPFQPTINPGTSSGDRFISRALNLGACGDSASRIRNHVSPLIAAGARKNQELNPLVFHGNEISPTQAPCQSASNSPSDRCRKCRPGNQSVVLKTPRRPPTRR
jgi:hypothetical protein